MQQSDPVDFLPPGIPSELRRLGRILHGPDEGLVAWDRSTARDVLACLRGTKVAVAAGYAYYANTADPVAFEGWCVELLQGEHATTYAERSQAMAQAKVETLPDTATSQVLFAFEFSSQDAAA
jgi:hypothetical protein